jgi:hypothetical protein
MIPPKEGQNSCHFALLIDISGCHDWIACQAPPKLRRSSLPAVSLTPGRQKGQKVFPPSQHPLLQPFVRHDEASCWPPRGRWPSLPSLGSKVTHAAGSRCRRRISYRTRPPPVVHTIRAPRGLLLRRHESHKGMRRITIIL